MRYAYREIDGHVQPVLVSHKTRRSNRHEELYGEHVPFHQNMLNAYRELEENGTLNAPGHAHSAMPRTRIRDLHQRALDEGF